MKRSGFIRSQLGCNCSPPLEHRKRNFICPKSVAPNLVRTQEVTMKASQYDSQNLALASWIWIDPSETEPSNVSALKPPAKPAFDVFSPLRYCLDHLNVQQPKLARTICRLIPAQCPFERDIQLFGRTLLHIPPLCKINPVYEEVVSLRFRALCYLADVCGEDVTPFC